MDAAAFDCACARAAALHKGANGIGTLGEKSLHAALKFYFEPDESCHELPLGGFVADIIGEYGVIEIQTRSLRKLVRKLDAFLEACPVTVVHPLCKEKYLVWHNPDGTVAARRKSNAHAALWHALPELYAIKYALDNPRFQLCLCLLTVEEHRCLDGGGAKKKIRATKLDRVPVRMHEEIWFSAPRDYLRFLPEGLPDSFSSAEVASAGRMPVAYARLLLNILTYLELLSPAGQQGNTKLYRLREFR